MEVDSKTMKDALSQIAQEIQSFNESIDNKDIEVAKKSSSNDSPTTPYNTRLKNKKRQIKRLRENFKAACGVAKTVITLKENEILSLSKQVNFLSAENSDLLQKTKNYNDLIHNLSSENQNLNGVLQNYRNFIELGFEELLKNENELREEKPSLLLQLKKIIISCGEFYGNYCDAQEKCIRLDQKNKFLESMHKLLQNDLRSAVGELNYYKRNVEQRKSSVQYKKSHNSLLKNSKWKSVKQPSPNSKLSKSFTSFDLTSHISIVNGLIIEQEKTLINLKELSEEFNKTE